MSSFNILLIIHVYLYSTFDTHNFEPLAILPPDSLWPPFFRSNRIHFIHAVLTWQLSGARCCAVLWSVVCLKNKLWNGGCWFGRRSEKVLYSSFWIHKYSSSLELTLNRKIKTKNERWNFWLTSRAKFSSGLVLCLRFWSWSLFKYDVKPSTRSSTQSKTSRMSEDNLSDTVGNFWWTYTPNLQR